MSIANLAGLLNQVNLNGFQNNANPYTAIAQQMKSLPFGNDNVSLSADAQTQNPYQQQLQALQQQMAPIQQNMQQYSQQLQEAQKALQADDWAMQSLSDGQNQITQVLQAIAENRAMTISGSATGGSATGGTGGTTSTTGTSSTGGSSTGGSSSFSATQASDPTVAQDAQTLLNLDWQAFNPNQTIPVEGQINNDVVDNYNSIQYDNQQIAYDNQQLQPLVQQEEQLTQQEMQYNLQQLKTSSLGQYFG